MIEFCLSGDPTCGVRLVDTNGLDLRDGFVVSEAYSRFYAESRT